MTSYELGPGESLEPITLVEMLLTVEADGRVSRTEVLSGPSFLRANAQACGLGVRFEPPAQAGLRPPMTQAFSLTYHLKNA